MDTTFTRTSWRERTAEIEGIGVDIVTYRIGDRWHCRIRNLHTEGILGRGDGASREEAEQDALGRVGPRLASRRRMKDAITDLRATVEELDTTLREKG